MNAFAQITQKIIREQELVIGPLARNEAKKVKTIHFDNSGNVISIDGDEKQAVDSLVAQYSRLFGRASREVCRDAVASLVAGLSPEQVPASLR